MGNSTAVFNSRLAIRDVAVAAERLRCIGVLLAAYAEHKAAGRFDIAAAIDVLATRLEHPELER